MAPWATGNGKGNGNSMGNGEGNDNGEGNGNGNGNGIESNNQPNDGAAWRLGAMVNGIGASIAMVDRTSTKQRKRHNFSYFEVLDLIL
jgi:hypothetical protein